MRAAPPENLNRSHPLPGLPVHELADADARFVRLGGVDVHHKVSGPRDAPAVLLSHHFFGSVATWRHVMAGLDDEYHVIAFDRPGFGLTERPRRRRWVAGRNPYTRDAAARLGWALLDHLDVEHAVLVGSSAGGTNALEMYTLAPERVRGLVLMSPAITGDIGAPPQLRPLLRRAPFRWIGPPLVRRFAGEVTRERIARSWHDPTRATDDDARPYQRLLEVEGWHHGFWELLSAEPPPNLRAVLPTITAPTLVVGGASDRVVSSRWNRWTADRIPNARYEELPACGHTPQEECPDVLLAALRRYLVELDAAAA